MRRRHIQILALILSVVGFGLAYLKFNNLGFPLRPDEKSFIWTAEARVEFEGQRRASTVHLQLPADPGEFINLDEYFIARNYGLNVEKHGRKRVAEWSIRQARGPQRLFYQVELAQAPMAGGESAGVEKPPQAPDKPYYPEALAQVVEGLLNNVRSESSNIFTFVSQLLVRLNNSSSDSDIKSITKGITPGTEEWVQRIRYILAGAKISTRMVRGLPLEEGRVNESLVPWLEVHNGDRWEGFNPLTGEKGYPANFLRWSFNDDPILEVEHGRNVGINFAVSRRPQALTLIAHDSATAMKSSLVSWSLYKLPMNTQYTYRILIMVPLGALVVLFMRTIIGVPTFGTFMPILIAMAFRETGLLWGIGLFLAIVGVGLLFRFYLNHLHLLLVARLSAVLTLVIIMMLAISLLSNELGLIQGFSIALFPVVILTMVIERMSISWDESGAVEAFKQGFGSLAVAVLGYLVMTNDQAQHLMFVFPELLLVVLAIAILFGSYTGYRLNELFRFRDLALEVEKKDAGAGTGE
ncbi:MAG: hypothetical protein EPO31_05530 [Gammaproteobacteria bacterium]|nr:MAG: hypothetical protein EPO31_05530 [Gammaproteobacteria bacterium]